MGCAALCGRFFSTNAGAVAFSRASYSNRFRFGTEEERLNLLDDPSDEAASMYQKQSCISPGRFRFFADWEGTRECGIGLELYLYSLKYFGFLCLFCGLFAIMPLYLNYDGMYFKEMEEVQVTGYFGSLGSVTGFIQKASNEDTFNDAVEVFEELKDVKEKEVLFDALYTLVFLVGLMFYNLLTFRIVENHRAARPTLADVSLKLTHLPESRIMEVAKLLESAGINVVDIVPMRHFTKLNFQLKFCKYLYKVQYLNSLRERRKRYTLTSLHSAEKKMKEYEEKLKVDSTFVPGHSAIFVFSSRRDKSEVMSLFSKGLFASLLFKLRNAYLKIRRMPNDRWLSQIKAKSISVPQEIYWENVLRKRYTQRILLYILSAVVILATASLIFSLKDKQDLEKDPLESCKDKDDGECLKYLGLQRKNEEKDKSNEEDRINGEIVKSFIGLIVITVNSMLPWVLGLLTTREKQSTMPRRKLSTMIKTFVAMFINTALVILLVNADFQDFAIYEVLPINNRFKDFTRYWYPEVGFSILISMFLGIFFPHVPKAMFYSFKQHCLKGVKSLYDTQITYNYWVIGSDIDLPLKTAYQLIILFTCLMYSGGMPLMLWICSLTMLLMYASERHMLKYYERPNEHSTIMHAWFVKIMPLAVIIHCAFSLYAYGAENVFPVQSPESFLGGKHPSQFDLKKYLIYMEENKYQDRIADYSGITFLCIAAVAGLLAVYNVSLETSIFARIVKPALPSSPAPQELPGGNSYHISMNEDYREPIFLLMNRMNQQFDPARRAVLPLAVARRKSVRISTNRAYASSVTSDSTPISSDAKKRTVLEEDYEE